MIKFNDFKNQTLEQIKIWAWAAAVVPITALALIFFVWRFFDGTILSIVLITGEVLLFFVAVLWWWWAMYVMRNLVRQWDDTRDKVKDVLHDIRDIKQVVIKVFNPKDK